MALKLCSTKLSDSILIFPFGGWPSWPCTVMAVWRLCDTHDAHMLSASLVIVAYIVILRDGTTLKRIAIYHLWFAAPPPKSFSLWSCCWASPTNLVGISGPMWQDRKIPSMPCRLCKWTPRRNRVWDGLEAFILKTEFLVFKTCWYQVLDDLRNIMHNNNNTTTNNNNSNNSNNNNNIIYIYIRLLNAYYID